MDHLGRRARAPRLAEDSGHPSAGEGQQQRDRLVMPMRVDHWWCANCIFATLLTAQMLAVAIQTECAPLILRDLGLELAMGLPSSCRLLLLGCAAPANVEFHVVHSNAAAGQAHTYSVDHLSLMSDPIKTARALIDQVSFVRTDGCWSLAIESRRLGCRRACSTQQHASEQWNEGGSKQACAAAVM